MSRKTAFHQALPYLLSAIRITLGLIFFLYGGEKLWGLANGRIDHNFATLHGLAGPLEVIGGTLLILGLFTRIAAFILCGEMAVVYFLRWAPRGFWPISNGGEETVIFCFLFMWLVTAGPGPWSLDSLIEGLRRTALTAMTSPRRSHTAMKVTIASWEGFARSVLRIILAFAFSLHGFRHAFGYFHVFGSGRAPIPMALDGLPAFVGYLEMLGGALLFLGLLTRLTALILCAEVIAAYFYSSFPRGEWPIRNAGNEVILYFIAFLYFAGVGASAWSVDHLLGNHRAGKIPASSPTKS